MIEEGAQAPAFTLPDQDGEPVALADFAGRTLVLYFYPKADTPGCTTQACGVRDHVAEYDAAGATVLGVSPDPVRAVKKFHDKQGLNFTLLADADHAVAEAYGVWAEKSMYGKTYWGNERTTFVIDADGTVEKVLRKVKPGPARRASCSAVSPRRPYSLHQPGAGSASLFSVLGAPKARNSQPSGPPSIARIVAPGMRTASSGPSSRTSSSTFSRPEPLSST